ncbi:hypothetical protein Tco_0439945 [Tanacetum coccineum]
MHQNCEKRSLAMTHKLDDMIEFPKSQPRETYKKDLECEMVMVKVPRCMSFLDSTNAYDELIEIEETSGTRMEVEPLDQTKLEDLGLTNHNISLSNREIPSVNELEPQLLPKFLPLDVNLGDKRGTDPPINPYSPGSFRMKIVDQLTIHILPSPHVAYYHLSLGDPKKHYGFKPGLLGHGGSLGVDFSKLEMIEDDFLGEGLSLPIRPKELWKVTIKDS